jgi:hypothetical protein
VFSPVLEVKTGTCYKILCCARRQHFTRLRGRSYTRAYVYRYSASLVIYKLDLSGMQAYANVYS